MSKKRHSINIPGVMLDSIRDNTDYENDERFIKRQKIKSSVLNRKENRKQKRADKKNQKMEAKTQHKENFKAMISQKLKQKPYSQNKKNGNNSKNTVQHVQIIDPMDKATSKTVSKKNKKKKRVSFSDHDDIREIPAREPSSQTDIDLDFAKWEKEFTSDSDEDFSRSEEDSQDEEEENDAYNLIETLKHLKKVQRGEYSEENSEDDSEEEELTDADELDDDQLDVMNQLAQLKAKKGGKSSAEIRIVKEDDLDDDSFSEEEACDAESESESEELDDEQLDVMQQLSALKSNKSNSNIKIIKEDEVEDDSFSEEDDDEETEEESAEEELDDEQLDVMRQLKALKGKKSSNSDIKIVKEDELDDDSVSDEDDDEEMNDDSNEEAEEEIPNDDLDEEQQDIMKQLAALKAKKQKSGLKAEIRIVKEDDVIDDDEVSEEESEEGSEEDGQEEFEQSEKELDEEQDEVMKKLAALKKNKKSKPQELKIVKEDDLDDDSLSESEQGSEEFESEAEEEEEEEEKYDSPSIFGSKDDDDLNYYAKKLGIDSKSKLKGDDEDFVGSLFDGLDFMDQYDNSEEEDPELKKKEEKKAKKEKKEREKKEKEFRKESERTISEHDRDMLRKDDDDIDYYAKKLGISSKQGLKKQDDDDIIGGLFDGIDLGFANGDENGDVSMSDVEEKESEEEQRPRSRKGEAGDDEVNSDDFDDEDDLDEDDKALLREMYGLDDSGSGSDSEYDSDESDDGQPRVRENPYMAPVEPGTQEAAPPGSKYIPPALRRKMAMGQDNGDSEELKKLIRLIKGPFNKLAEPTLSSVISELNNLYNDNPRQFVNEAILKVILQFVAISTPMLESFLVLYASAIVALYKLQGVEFGAFIIQRVVEEFEKDIESDSRTKQEIINVTGLLGYLYTLNLVSSTLIYDIIKMKLIKNPSELKTDVLLKLIKSCGSKLRSDDATALNSIILELSKSVKESEKLGKKTSTRSRFLIDTITDLKNNRLKNTENENTILMINRLKKQLGSINHTRNLDPIKVNLDDIENIEERGKWWLVGSAWKGNETKSSKEDNVEDELDLEANVNENLNNNEDELLGGLDVNWMDLAKQCRMNTDIRRAIFISIMSAEDFMDAFMKLEKLNLKKAQKKEIPNILMHCATMESNYNPYYSFLAKKLSDDHSMRREFQLNLWDFIKELDGEESSTTILADADDDQKLWKILNMGRFFGFLIGEGSLSLHVLRIVNFLTASADVKIFLEIMLITILDTVGKKSEATEEDKKGKKVVTYTGKIMSQRVAKCDEQPLLVKGLQYFLNNKIGKSKFIKGKKQRARIEWGIDTMSDMLTEMLKNKA